MSVKSGRMTVIAIERIVEILLVVLNASVEASMQQLKAVFYRHMKNLRTRQRMETIILKVDVFAVLYFVLLFPGGGRVVRRCCVSYITGASN